MNGRRGRNRWRGRSATALLAIALVGLLGFASSVGASEESDRLVASDRLLASGDTGSLIADLQTVLRDLGHDPGGVDGVFGPLTDGAVRALQRELGVEADGIVGSRTREAIDAAVRSDSGDPPGDAGGALTPGDRGPAVLTLQRDLARAGLYRGPLDGDFGPQTASAVMAFHKAIGATRVTGWMASDWDRLAGWSPVAPGYGSASTRLEIDLSRQLLFFVSGGSVAAVMPVSSGNGEPYTTTSGQTATARTPTGDFRTFRTVDGWDHSYLGDLYEPWYFSGGYAIHGSASVPPYPASHGCIRVSIADADWLDARMFLGIPVHVRA